MRISETETIIKKILPYLERRGYDISNDLTFEEPAVLDSEYKKGFIDILVTLSKKTPAFLIEAKRDGTKISAKHKKQALDYGRSKKCLFVAITNGQYFELLNTATKETIMLNGGAYNKIPRKKDLLTIFIPQLKKNPKADNIAVTTDTGLPFRPVLPLTKLNHLIQQCHNSIRKIEKNEEHAFSDFSKILFLKLLEEKWDKEGIPPLYTFYFHELAVIPKERADQVKTAINSMIAVIQSHVKYGMVLSDPIKLKQDATYLAIVKKVSSVSWNDCNLDSKGTAFEYFVRATLKGKKLGQYFTPRPLVQLMLHLGRYKQILSNLQANQPFKVLDPACGTGGFLVFALNYCLNDVEERLKKKEIHSTLAERLVKQLKEETFFGIDAHEGVASSAKMNMIIAGDGHNNIQCADSLKMKSLIPVYTNSAGVESSKAHLVLTNPPFGTSEGESLSKNEMSEYEIQSTKGQALFIQKMIDSVESESRIVTVIDEGVLNTSSYQNLRKKILQKCRIEYIVSLPDETFKPNKINVKSSVLVLKKRAELDDELEDDYPVPFVKVHSLGYTGSGDEVRHFGLQELISGIEDIDPYAMPINKYSRGYQWEGFRASSKLLVQDRTNRLDYKYWDLEIRAKMNSIVSKKKFLDIRSLNQMPMRRGISPDAGEYVSEEEGFALVVKAGSNISKKGLLVTSGDYIEEATYKYYKDKQLELKEGDVLLASTGDGTLGKCCVYRNNKKPAIADGHVTIIRVDTAKVYPEFLCDYLRRGFGAKQIERLYTGSTGLIEITPDDVGQVVISKLPSLAEQKKLANALRRKETETEKKITSVIQQLFDVEKSFFQKTL